MIILLQKLASIDREHASEKSKNRHPFNDPDGDTPLAAQPDDAIQASARVRHTLRRHPETRATNALRKSRTEAYRYRNFEEGTRTYIFLLGSSEIRLPIMHQRK